MLTLKSVVVCKSDYISFLWQRVNHMIHRPSKWKALQELLVWCRQHESATFAGLRGFMSHQSKKVEHSRLQKCPPTPTSLCVLRKCQGSGAEQSAHWRRCTIVCLKLNVYQKMHSHFHKNRFVGLQEDIRKPPCTFLKISSSISLNGAIVLLPATLFHVLWHLIPESNKKAAQ